MVHPAVEYIYVSRTGTTWIAYAPLELVVPDTTHTISCCLASQAHRFGSGGELVAGDNSYGLWDIQTIIGHLIS